MILVLFTILTGFSLGFVIGFLTGFWIRTQDVTRFSVRATAACAHAYPETQRLPQFTPEGEPLGKLLYDSESMNPEEGDKALKTLPQVVIVRQTCIDETGRVETWSGKIPPSIARDLVRSALERGCKVLVFQAL